MNAHTSITTAPIRNRAAECQAAIEAEKRTRRIIARLCPPVSPVMTGFVRHWTTETFQAYSDRRRTANTLYKAIYPRISAKALARICAPLRSVAA